MKIRIMISLWCCVLTMGVILAQDPPELQQFEEILQNMYGKIYDLKIQAESKPTPELMKEIDRLEKEAKELEERIQKIHEIATKHPPKNWEPPMTEQSFEDEQGEENLNEQKPNFEEGRPSRTREILEELRTQNPQEYKRMLELRKKNPAQFRRQLLKMFRERKPFQPKREFSPQQERLLAEAERLRARIEDLLETIPHIEEEGKDTYTQQLKTLLSQEFDIRMRLREQEILDLQKQLEERKAQFKKRQQNKKSIVEKRMKELLGDEEWDW